MSFYDIYGLLPEIYLLTCICGLLIYGVLLSMAESNGYPILNINVGWLSLQIAIFVFLLLIFAPNFNLLSWNYLLVIDNFSRGAKVIIISTFILWFFLSISYIVNEKINSFEYWILSLLGIVGILFVLQANDLISMYLSIEFQSLTFYVLTSFKRTSEFSTESGLKYFVLGAFSSTLLLFGLSILYSLTGLTHFTDYSKFFLTFIDGNYKENFGISISLIFICTALLFKLSAAPFHMWSPDVYEGAPTSITAYLSIIPKLGIITLLLRFCLFSLYDLYLIWEKIIVFCAYLSILIGTFTAFSQKKLKRFIAYSSINHIGFFLIGFSVGELESIFSILFYIVSYIIMSFSMFFFLTGFRFFKYPNHYQVRYIEDLKGLGYVNPILAFSLSLSLFSMAGIPPLIGFFAKLFILLPPVQNENYILTIFAVLMSCIACFYYIRFIKIMYFSDLKTWKIIYPISKMSSFFLGLLLFLIVFLFIDLEVLTIFITRISMPFTG